MIQHGLAGRCHLGAVLHDHVQLAGVDGQISRHSQQTLAFFHIHALEAGGHGIVADHRRQTEFPQQIGHKAHPQDTALDVGGPAAQLEGHIIFRRTVPSRDSTDTKWKPKRECRLQ